MCIILQTWNNWEKLPIDTFIFSYYCQFVIRQEWIEVTTNMPENFELEKGKNRHAPFFFSLLCCCFIKLKFTFLCYFCNRTRMTHKYVAKSMKSKYQTCIHFECVYGKWMYATNRINPNSISFNLLNWVPSSTSCQTQCWCDCKVLVFYPRFCWL